MSKFDPATQRLRARVAFIRGTVRKRKGGLLTEADVDTMTPQAIADEIDLGTLEIVPIETEEEAEGGEGKPADDASGEAGASAQAGDK